MDMWSRSNPVLLSAYAQAGGSFYGSIIHSENPSSQISVLDYVVSLIAKHKNEGQLVLAKQMVASAYTLAADGACAFQPRTFFEAMRIDCDQSIWSQSEICRQMLSLQLLGNDRETMVADAKTQARMLAYAATYRHMEPHFPAILAQCKQVTPGLSAEACNDILHKAVSYRHVDMVEACVRHWGCQFIDKEDLMRRAGVALISETGKSKIKHAILKEIAQNSELSEPETQINRRKAAM